MSVPDRKSPDPTPIPESLQRQLVAFRRHLWRIKVFEAIAAGLVGLLVSFLLVYGLDRVWVTPGWARLVILAGGTSLFAVFAPYWLHRWVWRHRREAQLARLIARKFPGLGDRLLGVIELQDQNEREDSLSPRLRGAAMEAVAAEAGRRSLDEALPPKRNWRWGLALMVLAGGAAAVLTLTPRAGVNALKRWLMPLANTERYTFTRLADPPTELAVPYGEAFDVTLTLSADTEQKPDSATGRFDQQPPVGADLDGMDYRFSFPGQQDEGVVSFRVGDAVHSLRIKPLQRPFVQKVAAVLSPPEYLMIPEQTVDLSNGVLSAVEGSKVRIRLVTNRELAEATYGPTKAARLETAAVPQDPGKAGDGKDAPADDAGPAGKKPGPAYEPVSGKLTHNGTESSTPSLTVGRVPFEIPITCRDRYGLAGEDGYRLRVDAVEDAPPACYMQGVERQKAILPEETIEFEMLAEDDFGIKAAGIEWSGEFNKPSSDTPAKGELKLVEDMPQQPRVGRPAAFSPKAFGIEPQKITLRVFAEDYFPGRGRVYSEPVTLFVLTRDEHAQLLKSQFDRAIAELEDLARREETQLDETKRLDDLKGEDLQNEENRKRLETQEQAEAENTRRMEELTERMQDLMKDATRNGDIDKKTMQKMAESLKSMQELGRQDMPKVQEQMKQAQEQSNTPEKTDKNVEDAKKEQEKVVEKMKEAVEKANDANRRMEAGTFVNRLKKAAGEEEAIAGSLIQSFEKLLGISAAKVDPAERRGLAEADKQQAETASDVRWIQEDLGHYYARTEKQPFKEVFEAMRESKIDVGMEEVRGQLSDNHTYKATENTKNWAAKLTEWAKKLEGEMNKNEQGGGGEGGGSPEDEDFEFMLRVMKMVQQQQDLRAQTRALEQLRRKAAPGSGGSPSPQPAPAPQP